MGDNMQIDITKLLNSYIDEQEDNGLIEIPQDLISSSLITELKNIKIDGATVKGHHNCGALVGYITQETALVENCHVTGATIVCTKANNDADGDKAGALIGNATVATPVKDCTASNSTVSAGRDAFMLITKG